MHNTIYGIKFNSNLDCFFLIIQELKNIFLYQLIPIWNSQSRSFKNCTARFTFKIQIKMKLILLAFKS